MMDIWFTIQTCDVNSRGFRVHFSEFSAGCFRVFEIDLLIFEETKKLYFGSELL